MPASTPTGARAPSRVASGRHDSSARADAEREATPDRSDASDGGSGRETRTVEVRSRADGMTASSVAIDRDAIATTPKRSAEDLLRLVPGLLVVQHGNQGKGYQLFLRGFDAVHGSDVEMLVDDVPLNEPSNVHAHGYLDPAFVIPEAVTQVEATKGAYRLEQGNFATAGSIRYRLGVPRDERGTRTTYEVGSTNRHRLALVHAPRGRPESSFIAVEALRDGGYGDNREAARLSGMSQVRLWSGRRARIDLLASGYGARFGLPGTVRLDDYNAGRIGFYDSYIDDTAGRSARALSALRVATEWGGGHMVSTAWGQARRLVLDESFTGDLQFPEHGDRHLQLHEAGSFGVRASVDQRIVSTLRFVGHVDWRGDAIDQRVDRLTPDGETWDVSRSLRIRQDAFGVGAGLRWAPASWVLLDAGARLDVFDVRVKDRVAEVGEVGGTRVQPSPRVTTRFFPAARWQLFAAYGRGLRSPEARAFTLPDVAPADRDLDVFAGGEARTTVTDDAEVGARFRLAALFDTGVALFGTWIARESAFDHVSGFNVELSGTRRLGVEADVRVRPRPWLGLGFDFTAVRARFVESGAAVPGAPSILASSFASLVHPEGWRAGLRWFVVGPRALSHGARSGVRTVMDVSLGYRWSWVQVDLSLDNVFGSKWREGEYNFASHWDPERPRSRIPTVHYVAGYPFIARVGLTAWF